MNPVIVSWVLILIAVLFDLRSKTLPVLLVYLSAAWSLLYGMIGLLDQEMTFQEMLLGVIPGLLLLFVHAFGGGIGEGDAYFAMSLGPVFGMEKMCAALFLSFFLCAMPALVLMAFKKVTRKTALPFLPFFAAGMGVIQFVF